MTDDADSPQVGMALAAELGAGVQTDSPTDAVIIGLLLGFLAVAYGLDWVKQVLGRWPQETCQVRKKARKRRRGLFCGSQCPIGEAIWPTILAHENAVLYCE